MIKVTFTSAGPHQRQTLECNAVPRVGELVHMEEFSVYAPPGRKTCHQVLAVHHWPGSGQGPVVSLDIGDCSQ